jgi:hypothetical protein
MPNLTLTERRKSTFAPDPCSPPGRGNGVHRARSTVAAVGTPRTQAEKVAASVPNVNRHYAFSGLFEEDRFCHLPSVVVLIVFELQLPVIIRWRDGAEMREALTVSEGR